MALDMLHLLPRSSLTLPRRGAQDITRRLEDTIVQHDSLKLELKRLTELASARADEVFNLENRKNQLQLSMREREKEVFESVC